jgi:hypothetical protein
MWVYCSRNGGGSEVSSLTFINTMPVASFVARCAPKMSQQPLNEVSSLCRPAAPSECNALVLVLSLHDILLNSTLITSVMTDSVANLGNGLVEIAALTSLIGSETAERLVLGNKGPAGLVWATITTFGGASVVKACFSAVIPSWIRDSIAVWTPATDAAIGLSLDLNKNGSRYRATATTAKGVGCHIDEVSQQQ